MAPDNSLKKAYLPNIPLPEPLRGSDPDSFPQRTISQRLPGIARDVLRSSEWHPEAQSRLQELVDEMPHGRLRDLDDPQAPDAEAWARDFSPSIGMTWLEAPWFPAETYFFRRILEATGYYRPGPGFHRDPYLPQKRQEREPVYQSMRSFCSLLDPVRQNGNYPRQETRNLLAEVLRTNIWGNQADRSMWPAGNADRPEHQPGSRRDAFLLVDHADQVADFLVETGKAPSRVDIILDNGGIELASDLGLVDFLLSAGLAGQVVLHAKPHPTYVSDVTIPDIGEMLDFLEAAPDAGVRGLSIRLHNWIASGKILHARDYYWTSPRSGWEMPEELRAELSRSRLVISKGDANYRRWMGDRHWSHTTPVEEILAYFPAPLVMLRVLKANLAVGLRPGLSETLDQEDPGWLVNGNWGMIQFTATSR